MEDWRIYRISGFLTSMNRHPKRLGFLGFRVQVQGFRVEGQVSFSERSESFWKRSLLGAVRAHACDTGFM